MSHSFRRWVAVAALAVVARTAVAADAPNQLTDDEKKAGWKLLFDGKSLDGWHNFKQTGVKPGWKVEDGNLVCANPKNAGDIVTKDTFDWFELSIEFKMTEGGNSGIIFHVTEAGGTVWQTGPEIQLQDNKKGTDPQKCAWLYQIYKPENDPKTMQPIDATKPVGEWNHLKVVIAKAPAKSEIALNGTKYFDFEFGSDDFKARIAKSKFAKMKDFAKSGSGALALQGDHGAVAFRNIKVKPLTK